jgi:hypothetical protein
MTPPGIAEDICQRSRQTVIRTALSMTWHQTSSVKHEALLDLVSPAAQSDVN